MKELKKIRELKQRLQDLQFWIENTKVKNCGNCNSDKLKLFKQISEEMLKLREHELATSKSPQTI